ncbi:MAG: RNA polymerase sigma factor [Gammaproteobacteria bacterium]|nr:RNA polymerase sigma factor [Gammaproteobacteria bacterium]
MSNPVELSSIGQSIVNLGAMALPLTSKAGLDEIAGAVAGDDQAGEAESDATTPPEPSLDEFLASVEQRAFGIAFYALREEQAALDTVQDAMLKLVEKYADRSHREWPPLFFTILNNRITDVRRWRKLRETGGKLFSIFRSRDGEAGEENLLDSGLGTELASPLEDPERQTLSHELRGKIDGAITSLSERQRQVFLLREWQGFNVRDTARILGCSEGSVKQHHFRAMKALRIELAEVWNHE